MKFMFSIFSLMLAIFVGPVLSSAQSQSESDDGSLQYVMKQMGQDFKEIRLNLKASQVSEKTVNSSVHLLQLIELAAQRVPPQFLDDSGKLRVDKKAEASQFQKKILDDLKPAATELIEALKLAEKTGDASAATKILREKLLPIQKEGHDSYKEARDSQGE